jgi:hypothetical protein
MATASETPKQAAAPLPHKGDHDRVAMLSLKADGTPDQHNPEFITDAETALAVTKRQFAEQAISAVDVAERGVTAGAGSVTLVGQDDGSVKEQELSTGVNPVADLQRKHEDAAKSAESAAESAVKALS